MQDTNSVKDEVLKLLEGYLALFPHESEKIQKIQAITKTTEDLGSRKNIPDGHLCSNAVIIDPKLQKVFLLHHKFLNIWVFPGGHFDYGDSSLVDTAVREAVEETGLSELKLHQWHFQHKMLPIHIEINQLPENPKKQEGEHQHFDFYYLFESDSCGVVNLQPQEVMDYKWEEFKNVKESISALIISKINKL